jgi:hypothetical protein
VPKRDASSLQIGSSEHDLLRLLEQESFPRMLAVEPVADTSLGGLLVPWHAFQRRREMDRGQAGGERSWVRI